MKTTDVTRQADWSGSSRDIASHNFTPAHLLKRTEQTLNAAYLARCRSDGLRLTLPQLLYLCAAWASPGGHQAAIARLVGMDTPTGALVAGALERKDWVERRESESDRRRKIVTVTKGGEAVRTRGLAHLAAATGELFGPAAPSDRLVLHTLLAKIAAHRTASPPPLLDLEGQSVAAPDFLPPQLVPGFLVGRCLQVAVALVAPALEPFDLTIRQYVVLTLLAILGPCSLRLLTEAMGSERSSLAIVLPRLEERGLIDVQKERRSVVITLTACGRKLLAQAGPAAEAANESIAAELNDAERAAFTETLGNVLGHHGKLLRPDDVETLG